MMAPMRCDHCDSVLDDDRIERDHKRFCCMECARAFDRGELKAISPHLHDGVVTRTVIGARR